MKRPFKEKRPIGPIFGKDGLSLSQLTRIQSINEVMEDPTETVEISPNTQGLEPENQTLDDSGLYS
jgi:hypothetical protein